MRDLDGTTALVTGAGSGNGRATALALAAGGARLIVCDVDEATLGDVERTLGPACLMARRVDVADRAAMRAFAAEVHGRVAALDILVNNAGVGLQGGVLDTSLEDWDWVLGINLGGVIHGCHFFAPPMVARRRGHIVNVSSMLGYFGAPGILGYCTSKFAVFGLSESLRAELVPHGVQVSTICPGMIDTSILAGTRFRGDVGEGAREKSQALFHKRNYTPEKVAKGIVDAIRKGTAVRPISPEAWTIYLVKRFAPGLLGPLGREAWKRVVGARSRPRVSP
jgi:NAD(P)-dependent dehydrogenase (short-subunit alcohol dehydrogenase family)